MRIVGLDLGTKTLGVAVSDPLKIIASGLVTLRFQDEDFNEALIKLKELLKTYEISHFVIGLPLHMHGQEGIMASKVRLFASQIETEFNKKVVFIDERLTSTLATKFLLQGDVSRQKRKNVVDKMAAVIILQNYLDTKREE